MPHPQPMRSARSAATIAFALAISVAFSACSKSVIQPLLPNQPPTVRLTGAPLSPRQVDAVNYEVRFEWIGDDPDGRIARFRYVSDPPATGDTAWTETQANGVTIRFSASNAVPYTGTSDEPHVFVLVAVDDRGARSPLVTRAFFAKTIAPTVQIELPGPTPFGTSYLPQRFRVRWSGEDPDGVTTRKPVRYKYTLLTDATDVSLATALTDRDSVRRYYAPRGWAGWDSLPGESLSVVIGDLEEGGAYLFVVVAFDEAGAYSPVFSRTTNMLVVRVSRSAGAPAFAITTPYSSHFGFPSEVGPNVPPPRGDVEFPANRPFRIGWQVSPSLHVATVGTRWAVDIEDLGDETPRSGPQDYAHWSAWGPAADSARIDSFSGLQNFHTFCLESLDENGVRWLMRISLRGVSFNVSHDLLIVKDTRLPVDRILPGQSCVAAPSGRWPTAAELDTFLFARGGAPWRCYPAGTITKPGLFAGYDFDTLGTRNGAVNQTVPLQTLAQYRHVIWITDRNGAMNDYDGSSPNSPESALRYMSAPNRANTLAAYLSMGGRVWLVGGGALTAPLVPYDRVANNTTPPAPCTTFDRPNGELIPGRFTWDHARWQSQVKTIVGRSEMRHDAPAMGQRAADPFYLDPLLPERLTPHSLAAGDSMPPNRTGTNNFYCTDVAVEYLSLPNDVIVDRDPSAATEYVAALDSLYRAVGATLVSPALNAANTSMTVYPARALWGAPGFPEGPTVIATGFDVWSWQRTQCQGVVDFVLQRLWGLPKSPVVTANAAGALPASPAVRPAAESPGATRSVGRFR